MQLPPELLAYAKPTMERVDGFVFLQNRDKKIIYCNQRFLDAFSVKREDIMGKTCEEIFSKDIYEKMGSLDNAIFLHNCGATCENVCFFEDKITYCVTKFPICNPQGVCYGIATMGFDISLAAGGEHLFADYLTKIEEANEQLKAARELADETNRAKTNFLINMSHELRTPLYGIIGSASLLQNSDLNAKQKKFADMICKSGAILLELINDLIHTAKIEMGQILIETTHANFRETIRTLSDLFELEAQEKGLAFTVTIDPDIAERYVIPVVRLQQVLINLVSNALKFTEHGEISINITAVRKLPEHTLIRIEVKDTGKGIPKEQQQRVFERFWQGDTAAQTGTGIGLAISKQLMERMNGVIGFRSEEGKGTTFWIELPLKIVSGVKQDESKK